MSNAPQEPDELTPSSLPALDLDAALTRRATPRVWLLRLGVTGIIALLLAIAIWHIPLLAIAFSRGASTASVSTITQISVTTNVSVAKSITYNGHTQTTKGYVVFNPQVGVNTVTLDAPPFARHTCHFTWANQTGFNVQGGCESQFLGTSPISDGIKIMTYRILMPLTLADLPPSLQPVAHATILALTSPVISPQHVTVPAGDYYAVGQYSDNTIQYQRASVPLIGVYSGAPDIAHVLPEDVDWPGNQNLPAHLWFIQVPELETWQFTTDAGVPVSSYAASLSLSTSLVLDYTQPSLPIQPNYTHTTNTPCFDGIQLAESRLAAPQNGYNAINVVERHANGCAFSLVTGASESDSPTATPTPTPLPGITPRFLYRFGVLLAENAVAQALIPQLPLAPPDEIAAVEG